MAAINLNAARAARAETASTHTVEIGDAVIDLPSEVPLEFAFGAVEGDLDKAIRGILGDDAARFYEQKPSLQDLMEFVQQVASLYGFDGLGESAASGSSSRMSGNGSRPTSSASTKRTSGVRR